MGASYLLQGLLPGDVAGFRPFRQFAEGLQQQRRFARAGAAANQDRAARHAAQHAVKFFKAGGETRAQRYLTALHFDTPALPGIA